VEPLPLAVAGVDGPPKFPVDPEDTFGSFPAIISTPEFSPSLLTSTSSDSLQKTQFKIKLDKRKSSSKII
jgi:hypothetical protein